MFWQCTVDFHGEKLKSIIPVTRLKEAHVCMFVCMSTILAVTHMCNLLFIRSWAWEPAYKKESLEDV